MSFADTTVDIRADRHQLDRSLGDALAAGAPPEGGQVAEAMRYATLGHGQRLRPLLALRIGRMLNADPRLVLRAALSVELFHCASLVVDDLPCMDDDGFRRGRPSVHRVFGEPVALLASFSLVALGARLTTEAPLKGKDLQRMSRFQQSLLRLLDCNQLVGGQALDLEQRKSGALSSRLLAERKPRPCSRWPPRQAAWAQRRRKRSESPSALATPLESPINFGTIWPTAISTLPRPSRNKCSALTAC